MDNIQLLEYSIKNTEVFLDDNYMFIKKHKFLRSIVKNIKRLKDTLITIKKIQEKGTKDKELIDKLYDDLRDIINNEGTNYSEFGCFVNACDSSQKEVIADINLLKKITTLYLKYRDLNDIVPSEWVQAVIDKGSSRKKGQAGQKKLSFILDKYKYVRVKNLTEFNKHKYCYTFLKKTGDFSNKNINKVFKIKLGKKNQNKSLDLLIKKREEIYFLEAKHINTGGGGQNKQMSEVIDIIRIKLSSNKYHLISFLDGIYFNILFSDKNKNILKKKGLKKGLKKELLKMENQKKDIYKALVNVKNNYFINTYGFMKLFQLK